MITVTGAVGSTEALAGLTITNSNGATFQSSVDVSDGAAGTIAITDTEDGQTVSFQGNVTADALTTTANGYNVSLTGGSVQIGSDTTFANTGSITLGDASGDVLLQQVEMPGLGTVTVRQEPFDELQRDQARQWVPIGPGQAVAPPVTDGSEQ